MALNKKKTVFVLGAGFIGAAVARNLKKAGYQVSVSVRSLEKIEKLQGEGFYAHCFEVGQVASAPQMHSDILIISYPLGGSKMENQEFLLHADWINKHFNHSDIEHIILTSSTSVYPDGIGEVDENCKQRPNDQGVNQLYFEEAIRDYFGDKLTVLRLAGLVGENRNPGRFLAGRTLVPNALSPVNIVHQMDVVRFIESLITLEITGEIYNICNPKHPTRQVYYQSACRALGLTPPQFSNVQIKNPKVVSNSKSLTLNGFTYKWAIN